MAGETGCAERQKHIPAQINELQAVHARTNELLLTLRDRLTPVLRVEPCDGEKDCDAPRIMLAPLADLVQTEVDSGHAHNKILFDILDRLEV